MFKYIVLFYAIAFCSIISFGDTKVTPFFRYAAIINNKQVLAVLEEIPSFAFTPYSREEFGQLYVRNYKEHTHWRFEVPRKRIIFQKYANERFKRDGENNFVVSPREWLHLVLNETPENKKIIFYMGENIYKLLKSENNTLLNECHNALRANPNNVQLKEFTVSLEKFNTGILVLQTNQFSGNHHSDIIDFSHKYMK
jgi:hypothetical protein